MKSGYCPWCGTAIAPLAYHYRIGDIEWEHCRNWECKGSRIDVITDKHGFVIHPRHIRGRYIYSIPLKEKRNA